MAKANGITSVLECKSTWASIPCSKWFVNEKQYLDESQTGIWC
jgi:hypothetical protein